MSGFVVCPACGTRIKAGRGHCLRCFEPLPHPDEPIRPPIWQSLGLSERQLTIGAVAALVLVLALVTVIWRTRPEPIEEVAVPSAQPAIPATPASSPVTAPVPVIAGRTEPLPSPEPVIGNNGSQPPLSAADRADLESRQTALEQAIAKTPGDSEALDSLGQVLIRLSRQEEAVARLEQAVAITPARVTYRLDLARAAAGLGRLNRAIEEYREAARLLPQDPAIHYTLGIALQQSGAHSAAVPELELAIRLAPNEPKPHLACAVSLDHLQRNVDAVAQYRLYVQMRPTAADADEVKARIETLRSMLPPP